MLFKCLAYSYPVLIGVICQVYQKLVSRYHTLTQISSTHTGMLLDFDDQDDMMWMSQILVDEEFSIEEKVDLDKLPF